MKTINIKSLYLAFYSCAYFVYSATLLNFYTFGDRLVYTKLYEKIQEHTFSEGLLLYFSTLGNIDIGWFIVYFTISRLVTDFNIAQTIVSLLLFYQIGKYFTHHTSSTKLNLLFINWFINIQFLALSLSSSRLSIAFLFLFLAYNVSRRFNAAFTAAALASHITIILHVVINFFARTTKPFKLSSIIFLTILVSVCFLQFNDVIIGKLNSYALTVSIEQRLNAAARLIMFLLIGYIGAQIRSWRIIFFTSICYLAVPDPRIYQLIYLWVFFQLMHTRSSYSILCLVFLTLIGTQSGINYVYGVFTLGNGLDPANFQ